MSFNNYLDQKQVFVFELDDVIYPEKDYLLQVYYLFAQFIEYGEQIDASAIIERMRETYLELGPDAVFDITAAQFNIPEKYRINFDLLIYSARLPLKLFIFNEMLNFMKEIISAGKQIVLFTNGDLNTQLNKIKQIEWHGLDQHLKVYFAAETAPKPSPEGLQLILDQQQLNKADVLLIGKSDADKECALNAGVDFLEADKLLPA
ncbi:HAD hydrolase-like protein [Pedobacter metabolipauper]|uniref:Phosphoglycolate phosphatase-like HAD superfamily hydrolase n=1 Tax=Pedobacter metabolipauper TaxID=425513 RepID=A0A4R6SVN1_9SPHI|nr:HAD hydrolase-like protein [Pedobacter metabolipauper]TDQ08162.1 phosphoglycolate phosphatase-like HAD superfamily hydrolase [Pedobacter metabolipauper]